MLRLAVHVKIKLYIRILTGINHSYLLVSCLYTPTLERSMIPIPHLLNMLNDLYPNFKHMVT